MRDQGLQISLARMISSYVDGRSRPQIEPGNIPVQHLARLWYSLLAFRVACWRVSCCWGYGGAGGCPLVVLAERRGQEVAKGHALRFPPLLQRRHPDPAPTSRGGIVVLYLLQQQHVAVHIAPVGCTEQKGRDRVDKDGKRNPRYGASFDAVFASATAAAVSCAAACSAPNTVWGG